MTVAYSTADGGGANGALAGVDYLATSGTLLVSPRHDRADNLHRAAGRCDSGGKQAVLRRPVDAAGAGINVAEAIGTILKRCGPAGHEPGVSVSQVAQQISPTGQSSFVLLTVLTATQQSAGQRDVSGDHHFGRAQHDCDGDRNGRLRSRHHHPADFGRGATGVSTFELNFGGPVRLAKFIRRGRGCFDRGFGGSAFPTNYPYVAPAFCNRWPRPPFAPVFAGVADERRDRDIRLAGQCVDHLRHDDRRRRQAGRRPVPVRPTRRRGRGRRRARSIPRPASAGQCQGQSAERLLQSLANFDEMHLVSIDLGDDVVKKPEHEAKRQRVVVNRLPIDTAEALAASAEQPYDWSWNATLTSTGSWQAMVPLGLGTLGMLSWRFRRRLRNACRLYDISLAYESARLMNPGKPIASMTNNHLQRRRRGRAPVAARRCGLRRSALADDAPSAATLRKARQLFQSGKVRAGEELVRQTLSDKSTADDPAQAAGGWELLTTIYRESGRYADALKAGQRYQQVLKTQGTDGGIVAQRQENAVRLAEIHAALLQYVEAGKSLDLALSLPGGMRSQDRLWEARVHALQGRIGAGATAIRPQPDILASNRIASTRADCSFRAPRYDHDTCVAAWRLLSQSLLEAQRPQDAIAALEKLRQLEQGDDLAAARVLKELADCYAQLHDRAREKQTLLSAVALLDHQPERRTTSDYAELLDRLANVCQSQRDDAEATALTGIRRPKSSNRLALDRRPTRPNR